MSRVTFGLNCVTVGLITLWCFMVLIWRLTYIELILDFFLQNHRRALERGNEAAQSFYLLKLISFVRSNVCIVNTWETRVRRSFMIRMKRGNLWFVDERWDMIHERLRLHVQEYVVAVLRKTRASSVNFFILHCAQLEQMRNEWSMTSCRK